LGRATIPSANWERRDYGCATETMRRSVRCQWKNLNWCEEMTSICFRECSTADTLCSAASRRRDSGARDDTRDHLSLRDSAMTLTRPSQRPGLRSPSGIG
jgi:hypothetical protein